MKIRHRRAIAALGWCGTQFVRLLSASLRFDFQSVGSVPVDPLQSPSREPFLYVLWHENFLIPIARFGNPGVAALVSRHADGQLLGALVGATGMGIVHGSTSRGGVAAVRKLLRPEAEPRHLAVTPDGPRGPRRVVQPGVVYLASRTGMRVVPIAVGHRRPWRVKSWDAFAIPRPFSRVRCLFGEPIRVPPDLSPAALEPHTRRVQAELDQLTVAAESWANTGRLLLPAVVEHVRIRMPLVEQPARFTEAEAGVECGSGER